MGFWVVFYLVAIINNDTKNIRMFWLGHMFSFVFISTMELLGHMVILCVVFWGVTKLFQSGCIILYFHQHLWGLPFLCILPVTYYSLFDYSYPSGCEWLSHCSFDLQFPDDEWCWISFHVLICISYLCQYVYSYLRLFLNWLICLLIIKNLKYISTFCF